MRMQHVLAAVVLAMCGRAFAAGADLPIVLTPSHADGMYHVGETVGWRVQMKTGADQREGEKFAYTVKENNATVIKTGKLDLSKGEGQIECVLKEPGMVLVHVVAEASGTEKASKRKEVLAGAAVDPQELKPVVAKPGDFDAWWAGKLEALKKVPANAQVTPKESGKTGVDFAVVRMDNIGGAHVWGQLAKPKGEGKHPAMVILQYAGGPYGLKREWATDRAAEGWLVLNVEPHDVMPDQPKEYYDALPKELKSYTTIGYENRETSYFLKMYLGDVQAVEWLASRPEWDGKVLLLTGGSMGGQQSLAVTGLDKQVTHVIVDEPAGCDLNGAGHGRMPGYPYWPETNARVMAAAPYFDPINFAPQIEATCLVSMGFVDTTAPAAGIWTAFNEIKGKKEAAPMVDAPHNNHVTPAQHAPYTTRSAAWMKALVSGKEAPVRASAAR